MQQNQTREATAEDPPADDADMTLTPDGDLADAATAGLLGPNPFVGLRVADVLAAMEEVLWKATKQPQLLVGLQIELARELAAIWAGHSSLAPAPTDKRFKDEAWQDNPFYRVCLQGYLAWARGLDRFVTALGFDRRDSERARFAVTLMTDALAPSNSIWTNPVALRKLAQSGGREPGEGTAEYGAGPSHQPRYASSGR